MDVTHRLYWKQQLYKVDLPPPGEDLFILSDSRAEADMAAAVIVSRTNIVTRGPYRFGSRLTAGTEEPRHDCGNPGWADNAFCPHRSATASSGNMCVRLDVRLRDCG